MDKVNASSEYAKEIAGTARERIVCAISWRKALEDAALKEALGKVHRFAPSSAPHSADADGHDDRAAKAAPRTPNATSPGGLMPTEVGVHRMIPEAISGHPGVPSAALQDEGDATSQMIEARVVSPDLEAPDRAGSTDADIAFSRLPDMAKIIRWRQRNVALLRTRDGIEVYVRDSAMAGRDLSALLEPVRERIAAAGERVFRITLNGCTVWSAEGSAAAPATSQMEEESSWQLI